MTRWSAPPRLVRFSQSHHALSSAALAAHYATVHPVKDQMTTLPIPELAPCCNGVNPHATCDCGNLYNPFIIYP